MSSVLASVALALAPPVRHFINLSNGAEALALLDGAGVSPEQISFMRLQSSHCEAQDYAGILANLDHNLLMHLALGFDCRVYDFGSRGNDWEAMDGTLERRYVPRAIWWGLEWSRFALTRMWKLPSGDPPLLRGYNVADNFEKQLCVPGRSNQPSQAATPWCAHGPFSHHGSDLGVRHRLLLPKPLNKRIKYYRNHLAPGLDAVRLRGYYAATDLDGNKDAYREMLLAHKGRSGSSGDVAPLEGAAVPEPEAFATPMSRYDARTMRRYERTKVAPETDAGRREVV